MMKAIGKTDGTADVQQVEMGKKLAQVPRMNDEVIGLRMEGAPDVQWVEVDQTLARVPQVNDEVIDSKM